MSENKQPTIPTETLSPAERKFKAYNALRQAYDALAFWGTPSFDKMPPDWQEYFRSFIGKGPKFVSLWLETAKQDVLDEGLGDKIPDEWLAPLDLWNLYRTKRKYDGSYVDIGFDDETHQRLSDIVDKMYPLWLQLEADAQAARDAKTDSAKGGGAHKVLPYRTPEALLSEHARLSQMSKSSIEKLHAEELLKDVPQTWEEMPDFADERQEKALALLLDDEKVERRVICTFTLEGKNRGTAVNMTYGGRDGFKREMAHIMQALRGSEGCAVSLQSRTRGEWRLAKQGKEYLRAAEENERRLERNNGKDLRSKRKPPAKEILQIKPNFWGISIDIKELWKKLWGQFRKWRREKSRRKRKNCGKQ